MNRRPLGMPDFWIVMGQLLAILLLCFLEYVFIKNKFDFWNYIVPTNCLLFLGFILFMAFQVYLQRQEEDDFRFALVLLLIGPAISICFNMFKYATDEKNFYGISMMTAYHTNFFAQGIVN